MTDNTNEKPAGIVSTVQSAFYSGVKAVDDGVQAVDDFAVRHPVASMCGGAAVGAIMQSPGVMVIGGIACAAALEEWATTPYAEPITPNNTPPSARTNSPNNAGHQH